MAARDSKHALTRDPPPASPFSLAGSGRPRAPILIAAAVSALIVAALLLILPWEQTMRLWRAIAIEPLLGAAAALVAGHGAAGLRLQMMLPDGATARLRDAVAVSLWHGLGMILLPARLGELALIDGLRRYAGVGAGPGLAILLVQRIYDLLLTSLAFGFGALALITGRRPFLFLTLAVVLLLLLLARFLDAIIAWTVAMLPADRGGLMRRLHGLLAETRDAARTLSAEKVPAVVLGTALFWTTELATLWLIFRAFGTSLDLFTLLFVGAGLAFVHAVPLPTIGGLGLAEGGLAGLLAASGLEPVAAMSLGVSARLTLLALHALVIAILFPLVALLREASVSALQPMQLAAGAAIAFDPRPAAPRTAALLTVDVEDWFHVNYRSWKPADTPPEQRRVDVNTRRILAICRRRGLRGTFFVLGAVARDFPDLVREIAREDHEVACHGMEHDLVYEQGESRFRTAVSEARARLQDLSGQEVLGFRAPSWSLTRSSLWALDVIVAAGFRYDASLFPVENYLYGLREAPEQPAWIRTPAGARLFEIPAPALRVGPLRVPHGGGFYLRMLPLWLERFAMRRHASRGEPSMVYVHPRELDDVDIPMALHGIERLIQGARVAAGRAKLAWLLEQIHWQSIEQVYGHEIRTGFAAETEGAGAPA